jgi:hypothetical protein
VIWSTVDVELARLLTTKEFALAMKDLALSMENVLILMSAKPNLATRLLCKYHPPYLTNCLKKNYRYFIYYIQYNKSVHNSKKNLVSNSLNLSLF